MVFSWIFRRIGGFFVDFFVELVVFSWFFVELVVFSLIFASKWCKYAEKSASDSKILQNTMKINDFARKN